MIETTTTASCQMEAAPLYTIQIRCKHQADHQAALSSTVSTQMHTISYRQTHGYSEFAGKKDDLRRQSIASLSSVGGSVPSQEVSSPKATHVDAIDRVVMHLDIQLYEMEAGVFLVDFKCAGYETPEGLLLEEKDVTSPFPFLDLASKLIIQLAEAD